MNDHRERVDAHIAAQAADHREATARLIREARATLRARQASGVAGFIGRTLALGFIVWPFGHNRKEKGE